MTDTRDPRVAELVNRLVEQAPPAPPFPDEITAPAEAPRRRVAIAGVVLAAAIVVGAVVFVASRPKHDPGPVSPSTTTPTTSAPLTPPLVQPSALAVDPQETLYVADVGAHRIVAIPRAGEARVFAQVEEPRDLAFGPDGDLYVADAGTDTVLRATPDGTLTPYAGTGTSGFAGDGGRAIDARLNDPTALAFGPDDALYIADSGNERVRRVGTDGVITTYAGNGAPGPAGDGGPARDAELDPGELAFDGAGDLFVFQFDTKAIRRISPNGIISSLPEPLYAAGLATTPDGDVDAADYGNFGISRIWPGGTTFTLPFRHSGVFRPGAIAVAPNGDVYVADDGVSQGGPPRILRVPPDGTSVDVTPGGRAEPTPTTFEVRNVTRAIAWLSELVGQRRIPYADTVRSVRADGDIVVVSTTLVDTTRAAEMWEAVSLAIGCDDSFRQGGYRVVLADGAVVAAPRPGFVYCAGT